MSAHKELLCKDRKTMQSEPDRARILTVARMHDDENGPASRLTLLISEYRHDRFIVQRHVSLQCKQTSCNNLPNPSAAPVSWIMMMLFFLSACPIRKVAISISNWIKRDALAMYVSSSEIVGIGIWPQPFNPGFMIPTAAVPFATSNGNARGAAAISVLHEVKTPLCASCCCLM